LEAGQNENGEKKERQKDEQAALAVQAFSELRDIHQEIIVLRYVEKRPFAEVAAVMRCSTNAAKKRYGRALQEWRERVHTRGVQFPDSRTRPESTPEDKP
jgi:DNA-directed RNA polymerase specialized sigma24 family protein